MAATNSPAEKPVVVRTFSAGVHFGYLIPQDPNLRPPDAKVVTLVRSRRIHYWSGANSCMTEPTAAVPTTPDELEQLKALLAQATPIRAGHDTIDDPERYAAAHTALNKWPEYLPGLLAGATPRAGPLDQLPV